jgi:RNA polymerase sigma-70 factor, ECF subfamily
MMMNPLECGMASPQEVTKLLIEWGNGNPDALDQLMPIIYAELHRMARRYMSTQRSTHILQTTALINEAYIRLVGDCDKQWKNRAHFLGVAAKSMRHVLVDYARRRYAAKRGGKEARVVPLDESSVSCDRVAEIVALDDALVDLSKLSPRQSDVVELRYFGGLSVEDVAEVLRISPDTVMRDWRVARAWLASELGAGSTPGERIHDD